MAGAIAGASARVTRRYDAIASASSPTDSA